ncbi:MAG: TadE/TadG family type IV pilus assembly protein [Nocardioides sp.]
MSRVRRIRDERGALSIEFLLVMSTLMLVFLLMLQYAMQAHAHRVAQAAAEEALAAASAYDGSAASGEDAGNHYLADLGSLSGTHVTVTRTGDAAAATVTGDGQQVLPFVPVHVSVHLEGPIEHFVESP